MPKTVFSHDHAHLVDVLVEARRNAGLTQVELARRLGKDQSFISIIEGRQRRVDVIEFCAISRALGVDPLILFAKIVKFLPDDLKI